MAQARTALITGSTSGIGKGIAEALAGAGMNVVLNGFGDAGRIEADRKRLAKSAGVEVAYSGADMAKPGEIAAMMAEAIGRFGAVDVLVNCAGIQHVERIEDFPPEKWDAIIAIDLSSSFHTIRAAVGAMKARGWGRIVNIASAHALTASPNKVAYVAAKHGLLGLTRTVALEVAAHGVTVNAICPGYVLTPLVEKQIPDQARTRGITEKEATAVLLEQQPTGRFVTIAEVAGLATYLCSDAAGSINGAALPMDGGWTA
jgi:3-hydroxybutyrate dehydrogenase